MIMPLEEIRVGTVDNVDRVRDRLSLEFGFLAQQGFPVSVEEARRGEITVFVCRLADERSASKRFPSSGQPEDVKIMFRHYLANALSDLVVNEWEKTILRQLIKTHYDGFDQGEQRVILSSARRSLDCRTDGRPDLFRRIERKGRVLRLLLDYLGSQQEINLDGFITFRLQEYREQLGDAIGRAVDDFLMEKEYVEFINLLRHFVEAQPPKLRLVHAIILPKGGFRLMDDKGATVTREYLAESFVEVEAEVNSEDLLVSALITIAPERVVLHCSVELDRLEALDTIRGVFEGRVTTCRSCQICRKPLPAEAEDAARRPVPPRSGKGPTS
jgi:putative sporulation protein YtxC